jgi:hypothetical protein
MRPRQRWGAYSENVTLGQSQFPEMRFFLNLDAA